MTLNTGAIQIGYWFIYCAGIYLISQIIIGRALIKRHIGKEVLEVAGG